MSGEIVDMYTTNKNQEQKIEELQKQIATLTKRVSRNSQDK
jgi:hypothetical protein